MKPRNSIDGIQSQEIGDEPTPNQGICMRMRKVHFVKHM